MKQSSTPQSYYQIHEFDTKLRGQAMRVFSKPGLPDWERITPASTLLAEWITPPPGARILAQRCGQGALAVCLARQAYEGEVWLTDSNSIATSLSKLTLRANAISNARVAEDISLLPMQAGTFDIVTLDAPPARDLARRWMVEAHALLREGGAFYLAGANNQGIQSAISDAADLFGQASLLGYKERNRIALAIKTNHTQRRPAWSNMPGIAPGTWFEFDADLREFRWRLYSLPGVFAYDRLDEGTQLLLAHLDPPARSRVLDVGCGYGVIGLAAARWGAGRVDMIDVNHLAIAATQRNIEHMGLTNARAFASDALSAVANQRYDLIVTNPPFHAGKRVDYDIANTIIEHAAALLNPGGRFMLVANAFIRYDQTMRHVFTHVSCLVRTNKYQVLVGT